MPRDYTKVPGYEGMTQPQARYNYLHDLLDAYMRLTPEDRTAMAPCKVREERGDCRYCSFSGFLGGDPEVCCAWRAEAQPDKAIEILEMLLKKDERGTPPMIQRMNDPERPLEPRERAPRRCPICGAEEPEKIIQEPGGAVLGCDECLCMYDAWDWFEGQEGRDEATMLTAH